MADSKQLRILKALCTLIEGISTVDDEYEYDLADKVFRGKLLFGAQEVTPFVSVVETPRPDPQPDEGGYDKQKRLEDWELQIQGWIKTTQEHPTDALYGLKAAIEHRLSRIVKRTPGNGNPAFPSDFMLGRLITGVRIGPGVVRAVTPQAGGVEGLYLPLIIRYYFDPSDPWGL